MATVRRITERIAAPFAGARVDREAGVIYGIKLSGFASENGRDYAPDVYRRRIDRYDGATINFNHAKERTVEGVGGKVRNPRVEADGTPRGDAHLLKSHPLYGPVMEAAELEAAGRGGGLFGFSHVILAQTNRGRGGRELVEDIEEVESVDLVATPATTKGFFEGKTAVTALHLKDFGGWMARNPKSTEAQCRRAKRLAGAVARLAEQMGDDFGDAAVMNEPAADADPEEEITAAFEAAIMSVVRAAMAKGMDKKAVLKKVGALLDGHDEAQDAAGDAGGDDSASDSDSDGPKDEARKPRDAQAVVREVLEDCRKTGWAPATAVQWDALTRAPRGAERDELIAEFAGRAAPAGREPPASRTRDGTPPARGIRRQEARQPGGVPEIEWVD